MRSWKVAAGWASCVFVLSAMSGCDAIDRWVASTARGGAERMKPMKLTTDPEGLPVSVDGESMGQTPMILDANKMIFPMTFRVFFEEGQREFTLTEHEPVKVLTFDEGDVPEDIAVRDKAREEKARKRNRARGKVKVRKVKGSKHINPY